MYFYKENDETVTARCSSFEDFDCRLQVIEDAEPWVLHLELPTSAFAPSLCHPELWTQAISWSSNKNETYEAIMQVLPCNADYEEEELRARGLEAFPYFPDMPQEKNDMKTCVVLGLRTVLHTGNFKWTNQDGDRALMVQWILLLLQESFCAATTGLTNAKLLNSAHKSSRLEKFEKWSETLERNVLAALYGGGRDGDGDGGVGGADTDKQPSAVVVSGC